MPTFFFAWLSLAQVFFPIPAPFLDPPRVSPVRNINAIVDPKACASAQLGTDVSSETCLQELQSGRGFVVRFDWSRKGCGDSKCLEATNFAYSIAKGALLPIYNGDRTTSLEGAHAFTVDYGDAKTVCLDVQAINPAKKVFSPAANVCVYRNPADVPVKPSPTPKHR